MLAALMKAAPTTTFPILAPSEKAYLAEHRILGHSLWRFQVNDDKIEHVEVIY